MDSLRLLHIKSIFMTPSMSSSFAGSQTQCFLKDLPSVMVFRL